MAIGFENETTPEPDDNSNDSNSDLDESYLLANLSARFPSDPLSELAQTNYSANGNGSEAGSGTLSADSLETWEYAVVILTCIAVLLLLCLAAICIFKHKSKSRVMPGENDDDMRIEPINYLVNEAIKGKAYRPKARTVNLNSKSNKRRNKKYKTSRDSLPNTQQNDEDDDDDDDVVVSKKSAAAKPF